MNWESCTTFIHGGMRKILKCYFVSHDIGYHHPFTLFRRERLYQFNNRLTTRLP